MAGKKDPPEINASSMADIAFLLLVFFLVTTTMDTDLGLARLLPPPLPDEIEEPPKLKERNIFVVLVNSNDQLLVEGEPMQIENLTEAAKEFIKNPNNEDGLPEKEVKTIDFFGDVEVSKQVISLQNDNGTSFDMYIQVQNELARAYTELRNELSMEKWGKPYDYYVESGDKPKVKAIRKVYPQRISEAEPKNVGGN